MSDPIRWLEDGADVLPHERELLGVGRSMDPPPGAAEKIWSALGPHVGPGGGNGGGSSGNTAANGSAGSGSSGASITSAVGGIKGAALAIVGVTTIAGAIAAFVAAPSANPTTNAAHAPVVVHTASPMIDETPPIEPTIDALGSETIVSPAMPSAIPVDTHKGQTIAPRVLDAKPAASAAPTPVEETNRIRQDRASRLREESRVLGDARAALRSGNAASALEKLDAAGGQFPDGVLSQERDVLAIEALARAGQRKAASARAAAFLEAYPTSPHATKVRGFLQ